MLSVQAPEWTFGSKPQKSSVRTDAPGPADYTPTHASKNPSYSLTGRNFVKDSASNQTPGPGAYAVKTKSKHTHKGPAPSSFSMGKRLPQVRPPTTLPLSLSLSSYNYNCPPPAQLSDLLPLPSSSLRRRESSHPTLARRTTHSTPRSGAPPGRLGSPPTSTRGTRTPPSSTSLLGPGRTP